MGVALVDCIPALRQLPPFQPNREQGDWLPSTSLPAANPAQLDAVRAHLVDGFARAIFDATPEIGDLFKSDATTPDRKRDVERAAQFLSENRRDLQTQVSVCVSRNLDVRILPFLNATGTKSTLSLDAMTLMADERLEEEIAINQCTRRLKEQCEYELWGLTQRFCILTGRDSFTDNDNPVSPLLFTKSLMDALAALEIPPAVRLAVFKAFGPALLDIVAVVYRSANVFLTARGVDVDVASYYGAPVSRSGRAASAQPTAQELALGAASSNQALITSLEKLIDISSGSHQASVEVATGAAPGARSRSIHAARQSLHDRLHADEQVVTDIVAAVFDRLFVEPRIVSQLQPVIRRLQLPVLELALKDRALLTQVQHPVRKLIDLMAEFGLTLELNAGDESTIHSVVSIVDGLLHIHDDEPRAFELAFDRLDDLFYHHEEAALQRNESVRELERSEAREYAGHLADREIAVRLQNRMLPAAVTGFIDTIWRDVLINGHVKNSRKVDEWKPGLKALDDLLRSLSPSTPQAERARLAAELPTRLAMLQNEPQNTRPDPEVMEIFFAELQRIYALALAGDWNAIGGQRFVPSDKALAAGELSVSPSAQLAKMSMACGDWIETRDAFGRRRWRLNWLTSIRGTCVFKHYESNTTRTMLIDELRASLASGDMQRVRGLGLADEVFNDAFEAVSREARRNEVIDHSKAPHDPPGTG